MDYMRGFPRVLSLPSQNIRQYIQDWQEIQAILGWRRIPENDGVCRYAWKQEILNFIEL